MRIFFDIDGVVIDGWHAQPERRKPWDATIERDLGVDRAAFQGALFKPPRDGAESLMGACVRGEGDLKDVLSELLPTVGYRGSVDGFLEYWFANDSNVDRAVIGIVERLGRCDAVALYLATNQEKYRAAYLWNELGLKDFFVDMFVSANLGVTKTDAAFYAEIDAQLGIAPSDRPLFFDDKADVVGAAQAAGWDAHVFETVADLSRNPRLTELLRD